MCSYVKRALIGLFYLLLQTELCLLQAPPTLDNKKIPVEEATVFDDLDLQAAPLEVLVEQTTPESVTLSWKRPRNIHPGHYDLLTYSLVLTPLTQFNNGQEKEFSLPPTITAKKVKGLLEGTRYAVQLTAVYGEAGRTAARHELRRVSAPKFTVALPTELQRDLPPPPVGDDGIPPGEPPCNCSDVGMVACLRRPGFSECTCQPGYAGLWCEECAPGNFRAGKECALCPCTNLTSTAECRIDIASNQVSCERCLPGHRGSLCSSCAAGYQWKQDHCAPLDCASPRLCSQRIGEPGCTDCPFLEGHVPLPAQRSNSDRTIADGTLPLIGVVVTLGVLLLVAAAASCYRYWDSRRRRPRLPFWSIELQDDKSQLRAHCQYQHLDAATNKSVSIPQGTSTFKPRPPNEEERLTEDPAGRTSYSTMDV